MVIPTQFHKRTEKMIKAVMSWRLRRLINDLREWKILNLPHITIPSKTPKKFKDWRIESDGLLHLHTRTVTKLGERRRLNSILEKYEREKGWRITIYSHVENLDENGKKEQPFRYCGVHASLIRKLRDICEKGYNKWQIRWFHTVKFILTKKGEVIKK